MHIFIVIEYTPDDILGVTLFETRPQAENYYEACMVENSTPFEDEDNIDHNFAGEFTARDGEFLRKFVFGDYAIELREGPINNTH